MYLEWHQTGKALFANAVGREYIIFRRDIFKGVKYFAWCDMRAGVFAERGPVQDADIEGRKAALESLKEACAGDAEAWGVGRDNW